MRQIIGNVEIYFDKPTLQYNIFIDGMILPKGSNVTVWLYADSVPSMDIVMPISKLTYNALSVVGFEDENE